MQDNRQKTEQLTEKTWGRGWVAVVSTFHSFQEEEIGELLAKNTAKTARRQLDGRHLLFEEYLQS